MTGSIIHQRPHFNSPTTGFYYTKPPSPSISGSVISKHLTGRMRRTARVCLRVPFFDPCLPKKFDTTLPFCSPSSPSSYFFLCVNSMLPIILCVNRLKQKQTTHKLRTLDSTLKVFVRSFIIWHHNNAVEPSTS